MIFLDSWVWLEFIFNGEKADAAEAVIERANTVEEGGLIAPTTIAEVSLLASSMAPKPPRRRFVRFESSNTSRACR